MATYILFWNPGFSSYTQERFLNDFKEGENVGNWSFYEHEKVEYGDRFYMVKCGDGKTGIVMSGMITSSCYNSHDWSPKNRKNIYYADIVPAITINPWSEAPLLSPEMLTEKIPDFNWFGGHSGRLLDDNSAIILEKIWFDYVDSHPTMFFREDAIIDGFNGVLMSKSYFDTHFTGKANICEACGFSPEKIFGKDAIITNDCLFMPTPLISGRLKRIFYNLCRNCRSIDETYVVKKLEDNES